MVFQPRTKIYFYMFFFWYTVKKIFKCSFFKFSHFPINVYKLFASMYNTVKKLFLSIFFSLNVHSISCIESSSSDAIYTLLYSFLCTHTFTLQKLPYRNVFWEKSESWSQFKCVQIYLFPSYIQIKYSQLYQECIWFWYYIIKCHA